ncbi:MAG: acyltransferase family protein [Lachnospiraceae bacterium]
MSFIKNTDKNRIEWVDFSKGVAMLLVVIAHTMQGGTYGSMVRGVIYSFHMPLFFILSGFTMRPSKNIRSFGKKTLKSAKSLLIPGVLLYFAWICIELWRNTENLMSTDFWKGKALTLLFASASSTVWGETFIAGIGMIWFFFVLFWGKVLYDAMQLLVGNMLRKEKSVQMLLLGSSLLFAIVGIVLGKYRWLPFSLDVAFGIQPFFAFGQLLKRFDWEHKSGMRMMLCILIWGVCFFLTYPNPDDWTYLEVGLRRYSVFPISYLCALTGTVALGVLGQYIGRWEKQPAFGKPVSMIAKPFYIIGKNSMYLLCIHIMDQLWDFIWYVEGHQFLSAIRRLGTDLLIFAVVMIIVRSFSIIRDRMEKQYEQKNSMNRKQHE